MVFDSLSDLVNHLNYVTFQDDEDIIDFEVTGEITGYRVNRWKPTVVFINFTLQQELRGGKYLKLSCNATESNCTFTGFDEEGPKDGDKVTIKASLQYSTGISVLQAVVSEVRNTGRGELLLRFLQMKERLAAEGLFDMEEEGEEAKIINRDGLYYIRHFKSDIMLKVLLPVGEGLPIELKDVIDEIKRPDTISFDEQLVKKYVKSGTDNDYLTVGQFKHVPAGDVVIGVEVTKDEM